MALLIVAVLVTSACGGSKRFSPYNAKNTFECLANVPGYVGYTAPPESASLQISVVPPERTGDKAVLISFFPPGRHATVPAQVFFFKSDAAARTYYDARRPSVRGLVLAHNAVIQWDVVKPFTPTGHMRTILNDCLTG